MMVKDDAGRPIALVPPIAFDFEGWPAILTAVSEEIAVLHIEDSDYEFPLAKLPEDIRRRAKDKLRG